VKENPLDFGNENIHEGELEMAGMLWGWR